MFRSKRTQAVSKWRQLDPQLPAMPVSGMSVPGDPGAYVLEKAIHSRALGAGVRRCFQQHAEHCGTVLNQGAM